MQTLEARGIHFKLYPGGLQQQHLKHYNILIVCGPRPRFDGKEQLYFCDPDGYAIELFAQARFK